MMFKKLIFPVVALFVLIAPHIFAQEEAPQESDQQISEFSLAGYGDKGKKSWDIAGKSADIFTEVIKLKDIEGNMYGKEENVRLTAEEGDFNKSDGKVHLEDNVVITTSSGAKLTTQSLDWDRKNELLATNDMVNIARDNMLTVARGARGQPNLNKITLQEDVQVDITPEAEESDTADDKKIIITCDGPLEVDYAKNIATFKNNVKVDTKDNEIYSDIMDIYFLSSKDNNEKKEEGDKQSAMMMGAKIEKIIAKGNVKIIRGENISYSDEATYTALDKRIVLTGKPRLIIYSKEDMGASFGN